MAYEARRRMTEDHNVQSAIFSECAYAQTLANLFGLSKFGNCRESNVPLPESVIRLLASYNLVPRYVYSKNDRSRMLIQAGSCMGIDSALITVIDFAIYTIEFKEPGAKTSEHDLPKYGEDGILPRDESFYKAYPQFRQMLEEQRGLNFFQHMGENIHDFSDESVRIAVSSNYAKKYADVICTEDRDGMLVMLPANQVSLWAKIEGEIRPAGRNHHSVWTPCALKRYLARIGATFDGDSVTVRKSILEIRKPRGGKEKSSGIKINPLFFVRNEKCTFSGGNVRFDISSVRQLNPTIAGKMFFTALKRTEVLSYYSRELGI